jgi:hypothetical protein
MKPLPRALLLVTGLAGIVLVSQGQLPIGLVVLVPATTVMVWEINRRDRVVSERRDREIEDLRVRAQTMSPDERATALLARLADQFGSRRQMRALRHELGELQGGVGALPPPRDALFRLRDPIPHARFHPPRRFLVRTLLAYPTAAALIVLVAGLLENLSDPAKVGAIVAPLVLTAALTMSDADKLNA